MRLNSILARANRFRGALKLTRSILTDSVIIGTALVILFSMAMSAVIFLLSWLIYRDRYGISLSDYWRILF